MALTTGRSHKQRLLRGHDPTGGRSTFFSATAISLSWCHFHSAPTLAGAFVCLGPAQPAIPMAGVTTPVKNPYKTLGVSPSASNDDVKRRFRELGAISQHAVATG